MSIPDTQQVIVMNAQGATPELESRSVATPGEGEVLVKVDASSFNYHDAGNLAGVMPGPWPRIPMSDGAGYVVSVGPEVTDLTVGDRVMGAFYRAGWTARPPRKAEPNCPGTPVTDGCSSTASRGRPRRIATRESYC
jgi:NADPH:quinone reductase-like Zn-dependent oxidoreductase